MFKFTDFIGAFTRQKRQEQPNQGRIKYPPEIRIIEASGSADLTEEESNYLYTEKGKNCCPDCFHHGFYPGPRGGGAQNWRCGLCGMGFNLSGGLGDQRIGLPHHIWDREVKKHRQLLRDLLASHGFQTSDENWGIEKEGHYGIWIWPHVNFATIPKDFITIHLCTWDPNGDNIFEFWKQQTFQLPDPDFIPKLHRALTHDDARLQ